jgi:RNA polymerase sigma factor (sigma-70 family)
MDRERKTSVNLESLSDGELMARLAQGDSEPLGALYSRYGSQVSSLLFRLLPASRAHEGEDLCQEVFLTLYDTAKRYREEGKLRSWLFGIAVRKARSHQRKQWWRRRLLGRAREDLAVHAEAAPPVGVESRVAIAQALSTLPQRLREVLLLQAVEGLTGEEIARLLGIAPKTVWTRLHRARRALQESVKEDDES